MAKRKQKSNETPRETTKNLRQSVFQVRDFTKKSGRKIKVDVKSNQTFNSFKSHIEELFEINYETEVYYDMYKINNVLELFDRLNVVMSEERKEDVLIKRKILLKNVKGLKTDLEIPKVDKFPYGVVLVENEDPAQVRKRIKNVVIDFVENAMREPTKASFQIPSRSAENVGYDDELKMVLMGNLLTDKAFRNLSSVQSFSQFTEMIRLVDGVLREKIHATKRDLFYRNPKLFGDQRISDGLIEDLGAMLRVTRNSLNVIASAKG
ncbi:MAG: hypothetical protein ACC656_02230, partial [Candidatus Heimdallarchaeota archaeon]